MVYKCSVPCCKGNYLNGPRVAVFSFPKNNELQQKWITSIRRKNFKVTPNSKVCELHFIEESILRRSEFCDSSTGKKYSVLLEKPRLKPGAIPTLMLNCTSFPKNEDVKQKWINAVKRKNWQPTRWSKLCSAHFRDIDIDRTSKSCVRIREGAVPEIFPAVSDTKDRRPSKRKLPSDPTCDIFNCVPSSSTAYGDHSYTVACPENEHQTEEVKQMKAMLQCDVPHETKIIDDDCLPVKQEVCDDTEDNACENKEFEFIAVKQECLEDNDMNVSQDDDCLQVKQEMCDVTEDNDCENKEFEFIAVKQEPLEDDDVNLSQKYGVDQVVKEEKDEKEEVSHQLHSNEDLECDTTLIKEEVDLGVDSVLGP